MSPKYPNAADAARELLPTTAARRAYPTNRMRAMREYQSDDDASVAAVVRKRDFANREKAKRARKA